MTTFFVNFFTIKVGDRTNASDTIGKKESLPVKRKVVTTKTFVTEELDAQNQPKVSETKTFRTTTRGLEPEKPAINKVRKPEDTPRRVLQKKPIVQNPIQEETPPEEGQQTEVVEELTPTEIKPSKNKINSANPLLKAVKSAPNQQGAVKLATLPKKPTAQSSVQPVDSQLEEYEQDEDLNVNYSDIEDEEPQTIAASSKKLIKTAGNVANQRGAGVLNRITGLIKFGNSGVGFLSGIIRDQSQNMRELAMNGVGMASGGLSSGFRGAGNVVNSASRLGRQKAKVWGDTLEGATNIGENGIKLGGNILNMPVSAANTALKVGNHIVETPKRLSKLVTNGVSNIMSPYSFMLDDDEEQLSDGYQVPKIDSRLERARAKLPRSSMKKLPNNKARPILGNDEEI